MGVGLIEPRRGSQGRVYSVPVAMLPGARGDGQPVTTLIELESGTQLLHYFAGSSNAVLLFSTSLRRLRLFTTAGVKDIAQSR